MSSQVLFYGPHDDLRDVLHKVLGGCDVGSLQAFPTLLELYSAAFRGLGDLAIVDSLGSHLGLHPVERDSLAAVGKALPTIYMTAHTWVMRRVPADLGVAAIILKPFDIETLLATVEAVALHRAVAASKAGPSPRAVANERLGSQARSSSR